MSLTNYGAYYLTKDYKNILPFVTLKRKMLISEMCFFDKNGKYRFYSPRFLKHIPALLRLRSDVKRYQKKFWPTLRESESVPFADLVKRDPEVLKWFTQTASDYIRDRKLDNLVDEYLRPLLWGVSFFGDCRKVSTAVFLGTMMALLEVPHAFIMDFEKMISGFKKDIVHDSVVSVQKHREGYELTTKSGKKFSCNKLVMATPMHITNTLVTPQKINGGYSVWYYHVTGDLIKPYSEEAYNIFPYEDQMMIWREEDGSYIYTYTGKDRIGDFFRSWKVITHSSWEPVLYLLGHNFVNVHPEQNLFLANDHNVFGMESAYASGMCAAKLLMDS